MKNNLHYDFYRLMGERPTLIGYLRALWVPGFRYIFVFRLIQTHRNPLITNFLKIILRHYQFKFGFQIHPNTQIGKGFIISHFGSLIINSKTIIGENCNVNSGVVIGSAGRNNKKGCPKLGDRVWVGSNVAIVGGVTVGSDVLIAAGSFVNIDIPSHSIVFGNPCIIKHRQRASADYISHIFHPETGS